MKTLLVIFLVGLMALPVLATVDEDPNMLGVYFDLNADMPCLTVPASSPFFAYVIITNCTAAEVFGLEFGYEMVTNPPGQDPLLFRLAEILPLGALNVGNSANKMSGDYIMGLAAPVPGNGANITMVTWQYMLLAPIGLNIYLRSAIPESIPDGLPAMEIGGLIVPLGLSTGHPNEGLPVATVNGGQCSVVATEEVSFGSVKALFR